MLDAIIVVRLEIKFIGGAIYYTVVVLAGAGHEGLEQRLVQLML